MKRKIVIDTRESRCDVPGLLEKNLDCEYAALAFGDYQISDEIVFERKTHGDWEGSVMDGRIFKQAQGLKENFKSPVFILEAGGTYRRRGPRITRNQWYGSLLSISAGFGVPIIPTVSSVDTAALIIQAVKRLDKPKHKINFTTHKKGKTLEEQRQQLFSVFPGIGPKLAKQLSILDMSAIDILQNIDDLDLDGFGPKKKEGIKKVLEGKNGKR